MEGNVEEIVLAAKSICLLFITITDYSYICMLDNRWYRYG